MSNVIMRIVGVKVAGASSIGGALAAGSLKKDSLQAGNQKAGRSIREDHGAVFQTRRQGSEGRDRIYQRSDNR